MATEDDIKLVVETGGHIFSPQTWRPDHETLPDWWITSAKCAWEKVTLMVQAAEELIRLVEEKAPKKRVLDKYTYCHKLLGEFHGTLSGIPGLAPFPRDSYLTWSKAMYEGEKYLLGEDD